MAVIVRKKDSSSNSDEIIYRNIKHPISEDEIKSAEKLDSFLSHKMHSINDDLLSRGLLDSKQGDIKRWYALGEHLTTFVDNPSIIKIEDRMQDRYIWEALWFHSPLGVKPGPENTNTGTARDHFRLCYELQKIPFEIAAQFTWSDWVNFLETPSVIDDSRITDWVWKKLTGSKRNTLRYFTKVIRRQFRKRDLSVLSDKELFDELENAWSQVPEEYKFK